MRRKEWMVCLRSSRVKVMTNEKAWETDYILTFQKKKNGKF